MFPPFQSGFVFNEEMSQTLISPWPRLPQHEANRRPSGLNEALKTTPEWPRKVSNSLPLAASHTFTIPSQLDEASLRLSAL